MRRAAAIRARMRIALAGACAALVLALGGCATQSGGPYADWLGRVRAMDAARLEAESARLTARSDADARLRHAMLLAAPAYPQRDEARAQTLAEAVAHAPEAAPAVRDAAALYALALAEARRAEQGMRRAQAEQKRADAADARLREAEKRAQDAEYKLDALKQIERELSDRSADAAARPSGAPARP